MQAPLIINADCIHICISLWQKLHRPRQATQLRSWVGIGKVGILELEFFLAFEEETRPNWARKVREMILFSVLCTVYCGRGCVSLESERGKELA